MTAPHWVDARANRTASDAMNAVICQIKRDLKAFNNLGLEKRGKTRFAGYLEDQKFVIRRMIEVSNHRGNHIVLDKNHEGDVVKVALDGSSVMACRDGKMHVTIDTRWNVETQSCDMLVDDTLCEVWKISEMIVGAFLFGD